MKLSRRHILRGMVGGAAVQVGLPLLDVMLNDHGTAMAAGEPLPKRFGVFFWGGGIVPSSWVPSGTGPNFPLSDSFQDFAGGLKPYLTLVTGTQHKNSSPGHIPSRGIALSSSHDLNTGVAGVGTYRGQNMPEPSVDALVAEAWKGKALLEMIAVGICRTGPYRSNSSWKRGGTAYNRHEPSPMALWDRLFGGGAAPPPGGGMIANTTAYEKSMLDAIQADAQSLQGKLGRSDKARMDQHLSGIRALERQLQARTSPDACAKPGRPTMSNFGDGGTHEEKEAKSQIMSQMLAIALACDRSRVFSYEFSSNQSTTFYWEVGVNQEHHQLTHDKPTGTEMQKVTRFIMKNLAYLAEQLRSRTEGAGNLLDNTLILGTSEHATAGFHDYKDHPYVMVGRAGGGLRAGQHWRHPSPTSNIDSPRALLTAVRAVGVGLPKLGQESGGEGGRVVTQPISELLT